MLETFAGAGVLLAGIGLFIRFAGHTLAEQAAAKRMIEQEKMERAKADRHREENTGRHLIAHSDAFSAYKFQVEKEVLDLHSALAAAHKRSDELEARVTRLEIENDEKDRRLMQLRIEFEDLRRAVLSSHSSQIAIERLEDIAKRIQ